MTPRVAGLVYSAPVCCLDEMFRLLEKISHGQHLALAMLSVLKVALHWRSLRLYSMLLTQEHQS